MRILFFSDNFPPEGNAPASSVYERAWRWVKWGHQVAVVTGAPNFPDGVIAPGYRNDWYRVEEMDGIRVVRVKTFIAPNQGFFLRILDFQSFMVSSYAAGLFQQRPDVIVATSPQLFTAAGACALSVSRGIPFVMEVRDLWPASISAVGALKHERILRCLEWLELFLYRRAARVVVLTESFETDLIRRGVPAGKLAVVRNGVDLTRFHRVQRDYELACSLGLQDSFVVGYIGTHGMAHALERALEAAELLRDVRKAKFMFVGAGAQRASLMKRAAERQLDNVVFVDAQPKEKMLSYWSICDVALIHLKNSPLFASVIPSKIFEAMAMGKPIVIAAPEGEATRIVRDSRAGVVLPPEEPLVLARAVRELVGDGRSLALFGERSAMSAPRFTRDAQARGMIDVLEGDLAQPLKQPPIIIQPAHRFNGKRFPPDSTISAPSPEDRRHV